MMIVASGVLTTDGVAGACACAVTAGPDAAIGGFASAGPHKASAVAPAIRNAGLIERLHS
jgi:hypothetical protein